MTAIPAVQPTGAHRGRRPLAHFGEPPPQPIGGVAPERQRAGFEQLDDALDDLERAQLLQLPAGGRTAIGKPQHHQGGGGQQEQRAAEEQP